MFTSPRNLLLYFTVLLCSMRTLWGREIFRLSKLALVLFTVCLMRKKMLQTPQSSCFQCLGWNVLKWVVRGSFQKRGEKNLFSSFYNLSAKDVRSEGSQKNREKRCVVKGIFTPKFCQSDKQDPQRCVSLLSFSLGRREEEREEQQTSDNIQLVFKLQIYFFLLLPQEGSVKPFIPKKKASQLGCVFNALSLNESRKPAECFWCARRWPNCLFLGD